MRNFKNAFTIAELLLVIAIIGVISAMGATITKKTTAKAYSLFWHNGYTALNDAIADVEYEHSTKTSDDDKLYSDFTKDDWIEEINGFFNGKIDPAAQANNAEPEEEVEDEDDVEVPADSVRTRNGIIYTFEEESGDIIITMSVPAPKTRTNNGRAKTKLFFDKGEGHSNMLIPINGGDGYVDLSNRMDLLPVAIDDGQRGRVIKAYNDNNSAPTYRQSNIYSFREAYCRNRGEGIGERLSCTDADGNSLIPVDGSGSQNLEIGILTFPSPKH